MQIAKPESAEDVIHREIGKVNFLFQYLENELLEIAWFCIELAAPFAPPRGFKRTVKYTNQLVGRFLDRVGVPCDAALRDRFANAFLLAIRAADERNRMVHSLYRHHETFYGSPSLVRTWVERGKDGTVKQRFEPVTEQTIGRAFQAVDLAFDQLFDLHRVLMYEL